MSLHSSFRSGNTMKRHQSVLSRLERVKRLSAKGEFTVGETSSLGLPKVKNQKLKVKKGGKSGAAAAQSSDES